MKRLKKRGVTEFDKGGSPGEYFPDACLADIPDTPEGFTCPECGAQMVRTGEGWTCPECHPEFQQPGEIE